MTATLRNGSCETQLDEQLGELIASLESRALQLRDVLRPLKKELGLHGHGHGHGGQGAPPDDAWGVVSDLLSVMGLGGVPEPAAAAPAGCVASPSPAEAAAAGDLGPALDDLERGRERAWRAGAQLLKDLGALHKRVALLCEERSKVRDGLRGHSADSATHLEQKAVKEAHSCQAAAFVLMVRFREVEPELQDALEQHRAHRNEKLQWKAMSQSLLGDLAPASSKAVALSRLRRGGATPVATSKPSVEVCTLAVRGSQSQQPGDLREALRARGGQSKGGRAKAAESAVTKKLQGGEFSWMDLASLVPWGAPAARSQPNPVGLIIAAAAGGALRQAAVGAEDVATVAAATTAAAA